MGTGDKVLQSNRYTGLGYADRCVQSPMDAGATLFLPSTSARVTLPPSVGVIGFLDCLGRLTPA